MKPTEINLVSLFQKGCDKLNEEYRVNDKKKAGNLRAGSTGYLLDDGSIVGLCHRKSFARWIGQPQTDPLPETQAFFDTGFRNEDTWLEKLKLSWDGPILCEEEIPQEWFTSQGVKVSGRPDMVLCDKADGKPLLGIEHKAVAAVDSAARRWLGQIDPSHFAQACHYAMLLDIPYSLVYTFNGQGNAPWWLKKDEKEFFWKVGKKLIVRPFKREFRIGFDGDKAYYLDETGKRFETTVTKSGIKNYFELLVDMRDTKSLYKRHSSRDLEGKVMPFNVCNYCELSEACDQFENDYQRWVDEILRGGK